MANITTGRKSGFIIRGGRTIRRATVWLGRAPSVNTLASGTPVLLSVLNAAALALRPFTVVRTRGILFIASDQQAANENMMAAWAQCVVSEQASAIGVTAVPTPVTDSGSELFFGYQWMLNVFRFGDNTGFQGVNGYHQVVDSKAMRKVSEGEDLVEVIENSAAGAGCDLQTAFRTLIKLH